MDQISTARQTESRRERASLVLPASGHFTVFGITGRPVRFEPDPGSLGGDEALALVTAFGPQTHLFVRTPARNAAQAGGQLALKLGFAATPAGDALGTADLLARQAVTPRGLAGPPIWGNAVVACFDLHAPRFSAFRTLTSVHELYYWTTGDEVLCSDNLATLLELIPTPELDETILPAHFTYRQLWDGRTYVRGVQRLKGRQVIVCRGGDVVARDAPDLRGFLDAGPAEPLSEAGLARLAQRYDSTVGDALQEMARSGRASASLLSGGVDSTVMQLLIDQNRPGGAPYRSFSYTMQTPAFDAEVAYARDAVRALGTQHTFVPIEPGQYPALLIEIDRLVGYPVSMESMPCTLPLARHVQQHAPDVGFLFCGVGADCAHGISKAEILWHLERLAPLPGVGRWLRWGEPFVRPFSPHKAFVLRSVLGLLPALADHSRPILAYTHSSVYSDLTQVQRCFGERTLQDLFRAWAEGERQILNSPSPLEREHTVQVLNEAPPAAVVWRQAFCAHGIELACPYLDERFLKATYAIDRRSRYYHRGVIKPLLKRYLAQHGLDGIAGRPKQGSGFARDLMLWMKEGVLQDYVRAIERPGFIDQADFERKLAQPDWFTWNLLQLDLYQKHVLSALRES